MLARWLLVAVILAPSAFAANYPDPVQGDYIIHDYKFVTGQMLPELRLHYATLGTPIKDAAGTVRNAVIIMHGTGGTGAGRGAGGARERDLVRGEHHPAHPARMIDEAQNLGM